MGVTVPFQFLQLPLEFNNGLLEIEIMFHLSAPVQRRSRPRGV
jgi:hypothetical protein